MLCACLHKTSGVALQATKLVALSSEVLSLAGADCIVAIAEAACCAGVLGCITAQRSSKHHSKAHPSHGDLPEQQVSVYTIAACLAHLCLQHPSVGGKAP